MFRCYVAEDSQLGELVGYVLFFNTIDEKSHCSSSTANPSTSVSQAANTHSQSQGGGSVSHIGANAHHDDPVAVIEDLYVKPRYRGYGIATQLWRKVLKVRLLRATFPGINLN